MGGGILPGKDVLELQEVARPLVEYMRKKYSPHDTLIVTGEYVKIVRDEIGIPFNETKPTAGTADFECIKLCEHVTKNGCAIEACDKPNANVGCSAVARSKLLGTVPLNPNFDYSSLGELPHECGLLHDE